MLDPRDQIRDQIRDQLDRIRDPAGASRGAARRNITERRLTDGKSGQVRTIVIGFVTAAQTQRYRLKRPEAERS